MIDDGIIRFSPDENGFELGIFAANTSVGTIQAPVLMFRDEQYGDPIHILLSPFDGAAPKLLGLLTEYANQMVEQAQEGDQ